jgi:hypothetical protein
MAQSVGPIPEALRAGITIAPDTIDESANTYRLGNAPDYRWEGMIGGAVVFGSIGLGLSTLGGDDSGSDLSPVAFTLIWVAIGAGVGLLIGGAINKN